MSSRPLGRAKTTREPRTPNHAPAWEHSRPRASWVTASRTADRTTSPPGAHDGHDAPPSSVAVHAGLKKGRVRARAIGTTGPPFPGCAVVQLTLLGSMVEGSPSCAAFVMPHRSRLHVRVAQVPARSRQDPSAVKHGLRIRTTALAARCNLPPSFLQCASQDCGVRGACSRSRQQRTTIPGVHGRALNHAGLMGRGCIHVQSRVQYNKPEGAWSTTPGCSHVHSRMQDDEPDGAWSTTPGCSPMQSMVQDDEPDGAWSTTPGCSPMQSMVQDDEPGGAWSTTPGCSPMQSTVQDDEPEGARPTTPRCTHMKPRVSTKPWHKC